MIKLLQAKDLEIGFDQSIILRELSFDVNQGRLIYLMGKNGVGKSCLLKTISGLIPYQNGSLKLEEREIKQIGHMDIAKKISVLLTDKINVDYLTVGELISLARAPYTNWNDEFKKEDCEIVFEAVQLLGIEKLMSKYFSQLSDGQKQKVLLCRALAQNPSLLLLDEPTTYLDIPSKIDFLKAVKRISGEKNISVVMSTHDFTLINEIADEVWILSNDELIISSPKELKSSGLFEKEFGLNLD